uniref:ATP synthase F0 subunit 8 n=1 Tax=Zahniserius cylindricus TaxID=1671255 RepID=UPI0024358A67|nr:ATP synthase F0 subunit 8 [Zahniserius cylindricus]WEU77798.1 ATP synthase F0 subunit 8 [Zahniserius cylindricus]
MPQMAPMWWTSIMMFSLVMMILMMTSIYFMYMNTNKIKIYSFKKSMNWKWL